MEKRKTSRQFPSSPRSSRLSPLLSRKLQALALGIQETRLRTFVLFRIDQSIREASDTMEHDKNESERRLRCSQAEQD